MNPRSALDLAHQRQATLRAERVAPARLFASALAAVRETPAAVARAQRRTGWVLVEVGLRLAVRPEDEGVEREDARAA